MFTLKLHNVVKITADERKKKKLLSLGYQEVEEETVTQTITQTLPKPLERMNKAELTELALSKGIEVPERATNAQIAELIKEKGGL